MSDTLFFGNMLAVSIRTKRSGFSQEFEESFFQALEEAGRHDPLAPRVVLVGSNFLGLSLRRRLAFRQGGHLGVQFLTFVDLAQRLIEKNSHTLGKRPFPSNGEELLLAQECQELPDDHFFARMRNQKGFHRALKRTFHDLIDGGVTKLPSAQGKLGALSKLFENHRQKYVDRFFTTADLIFDAVSHAENFSTAFQTSRLFVYGFYDHTETQRRLLSSLSDHIQVDVWETDPRTLAIDSGKVEVSSASWRYSEIENLTRTILHEIEKNPKQPLHEFAFLLRDSSTYAPIVRDVLDRAELPYYQEGGAPIDQTRDGKAFLLLLRLLHRDWTRREAVEILAHIVSKESLADRKMGNPPDWDRWTRKANIKGGADEFLFRLTKYQKQVQKKHSKEGQEIERFSSFMKTFFTDVELLEKATSDWKRFATKSSEFLREYFSSTEARSVLIGQCESLQNLSAILRKFTFDDVVSVLTERVQSAGIRKGIFEGNGIFLGSMASARCIPFRILALPGLLERAFPTPPRPDPLLLDRERITLNETLGAKIALTQNRVEEERHLFHLLLAQAKDKVFLSFPRHDLVGGRELLPSPFLSSFLQTGKNKASFKQLPSVRWQNRHEENFLDDFDFSTARIASAVLDTSENLPKFLEAESPLAESVHRWVQDRLGSPRITKYDGLVESASLKNMVDVSLTASEIETYGTCPYRYFLSRVLRLSPVDEPDEVEKIRPNDRGTLIHDILFQLFTRLRKEKMLPLQEVSLPKAKSLLEEIAEVAFDRARESLPLGHQLIWKTEKSFLLADLRALLDEEARSVTEYIPHDFEVRFGGEAKGEDGELSTSKPITISLGRDEIHLRGRIDRLDVSPDQKRVRVVDYKTGNLAKERKDSFMGGKSVQLPIYLAAIPLFFPDLDLQECEAQLLSTSFRNGFQKIPFSGKAYLARKREFEQILSAHLQGRRRGLFPPNPGKGMENCRYCDFRSICGKGVMRVFERKKEDPSIQSLIEVEKIS